MSKPENDGRTLGEAKRDAAHAKLEAKRDLIILRARRAMIETALQDGEATADCVHHVLGELPAGIDKRCLGPVGRGLALAGIFCEAGMEKSRRAERNASRLIRWKVCDREKAVKWLRDHPEPAGEDKPADDKLPKQPPAPEQTGRTGLPLFDF